MPYQLVREQVEVRGTAATVEVFFKGRRVASHPRRTVLGIMQLGRRHGDARLDAASARAIAIGSCRYRTVKNILVAGQDRLPPEPPAETIPTPNDTNIRGADYYAAVAREEDPC